MKTILKYIWKNKSFFMLIAIAVLIVLLLQQCNNNKIQKQEYTQNEHALNDKINTFKLKNGELISEKAVFVGTIDDLKKTNSKLSDMVEEIKKTGGTPEVITETKVVFVDSGKVNNKLSIFKDDNYALDFEYIDSNSIIYIKGKSNFTAKPYLKYIDNNGKYNLGINISSKYTEFDTIKFHTGLIVGIKKDKDGIERAFAKPDPYTKKITFQDIDATELDKFYKEKYANKTKKIAIGPNIGYGICVSPKSGTVVSGLYFGVGVTYSIIKF